MKVGISIAYSRAEEPTAKALFKYAEAIEEAGFHSIYFTDHYLHYVPSLHSVSAAAIAIQATDRVKVGFSAYVLPLRHPIMAAHEAASLDQISGGRLEFGVAAGSHEPEFQAFGIPFFERGQRLEEGIQALKALWRNDGQRFEGKYWRFEGVKLMPGPVQEPHPRLWIGSWAGPPRAARRIAAHADGWQASGLHTTVEAFQVGNQAIDEACVATGRDPKTVARAYVNAVTHIAATKNQAWTEAGEALRQKEELRVIGTVDDAIAHLRRLQRAGVEEVTLLLPGWSHEQLRVISKEVLPELIA